MLRFVDAWRVEVLRDNLLVEEAIFYRIPLTYYSITQTAQS
jgi:hypothetical protein